MQVVIGKARQKKLSEQAASAEALKVLVQAGVLQFSTSVRPVCFSNSLAFL